ncbi:MAG: fibronectin type III domain-containing protein [Clostridia bacterium]|nr:fibronectin type III domain-containing protein [Clostridia bacterium]
MRKYLILALFVAALAFVACENEGTVTYAPLDTPTSVSAYQDEEAGAVVVSWAEVADAAYYVVYYNVAGDPSYSKSDRITSTEFDYTDYDFGTTYQFKVRAENGNTLSDFSSTVSCTTLTEEESPAATPTVSNIRPGLGWININIAAPTIACTYEVYDNGEPTNYGLELIKTNDSNGSFEYSISGLDLNTTYTTLQIIAVGEISGKASKPASLGTVTTLNMWQKTRNPSARHLSFEWDDAAAGLNWTFAAPDVLTRTFQLQLATDENFQNIVYDMYTVNNTTGAYGQGTWIGSSSDGSSQTSPNAASNTNVCFSFLQPATTYYLRVRNIADLTISDYCSKTLALAAANGTSAWSAVVSGTTEPAHEAVSGELMYQPFDDHGWNADHANDVCGLIPVGTGTLDYTADEWTGNFGLLYPQTGTTYSGMSAAATGTFNGEASYEGQTTYSFGDKEILPSMKGWYCSTNCVPTQGNVKIGQTKGTTNEYLITPAFDDIDDGTDVTISFDASAVHACSMESVIYVKIFRAATGTLDTDFYRQVLPGQPVEISPNNNGFHIYVDFVNYSTTATLNQGDRIVFETNGESTYIRCLLDNILVVKK